MGDITVHELIWGYLAACIPLAAFISYAIKHHWLKRVLLFLKLVKDGEQFGKHTKVKKMLAELRVETRADRAHVVQFHNGDYYDNKSSIKKFTYCYEDLKNGVTSTGSEEFPSTVNHYKDCLVSSYIDGLETLMNTSAPVNKLKYSDLPSGLYKSRMIDDGIHLQVGVPLYGLVEGVRRIIGYILLSYNSDRPSERCSFDALTFEGHIEDAETHDLTPRACDGTCKDCRFNRYIPLMERALEEKS